MNEWTPTSPIRNFGKYHNEQFEKMRDDLGIAMSAEALASCAAFYARAKRDPMLCELSLLDRLAALPTPPAATGFSQLDTNDEEMAKTYADMMNKRRELRPEANAPATAGELFFLADAALSRGGKERELNGVSASLSEIDLRSVGSGSVGAVGSSAILHVSDGSRSLGKATVGDVFLLIRRGDLSPRAFRKVMNKSVGDPAFLRPLHGIFRIDARGVLPLLLSVTAGLYLDLNRMGFGRETSPEMLAGELEDDWIAVLPKENAAEVLRAITSLGMQGTMFAAITAGAQTVIVTSERKQLSFETAFLRGLNATHPVSAILKDETDTDPIAHLPLYDNACRYFADEQPIEEVVNIEKVTVSVASATVGSAPFRTALITSLAPVLTLAAFGADYSEARLAVDLAVPQKTDCGELLATILGVYRTQAELGIPASAKQLRTAQTDRISLTVFSIAKSAERPSRHFTAAENGLYLVSVPMDDNGIPDFPLLRKMLTDLTSVARKKNILSAKVLVNEAITDALHAMRGNGLFAKLTDPAVVSGGALPIAVLIEAQEKLPFARIGTVAETDAKTASDAAFFRLPCGNGLIFRETPEAVILADPNDADAQIFAERLIGRGLHVTVFAPDEQGALSRAMLTANAAFVCGAVTWEETAQIAFARSVLEQNGGGLVSIGSPDPIPENIPHQAYPNGLPPLF